LVKSLLQVTKEIELLLIFASDYNAVLFFFLFLHNIFYGS